MMLMMSVLSGFMMNARAPIWPMDMPAHLAGPGWCLLARTGRGPPIWSPGWHRPRPPIRQLCLLLVPCQRRISIVMPFRRWTSRHCLRPSRKKPGPCHLLTGCRKYSARRFARRWPRVAGRCRSICHAMCLPHRPTFLTGRHLPPIGLTACRRRIPTRSRRQRAFWRMPDNR